MKFVKISLFVLPLLIFSTQLFGLGTNCVAQYLSIGEDSLVIQKNGPKNQFVIYTGNVIKVWTDNKATVKGKFVSFDGFNITINNDGLKLKIPINTLSKVKRFGNTGVQILGTVILVAGVGLMVAGGAGVIAGLILLLSDSAAGLAYPAIILGGALYGGLGFALWKGGDAIIGRRVNLNKGWSIIQPQ